MIKPPEGNGTYSLLGAKGVVAGFASTAGGVDCWGVNSTGQLGDYTTTQRTTPVQVFAVGSTSSATLLSGVASIAAGNGRTLSNTGVTFADCAAGFSGSHTAFSTQPWTLNLRPYSALTVEYFVRTTATNVMEALEHSSNFTTARGGFVSVLNEVNRGQIESGFSMPGTSSYNIDSTSAGAVSDGTWHHVALVYDPARSGEDRVRFYLDRVQQGKRTAAWNSDADTFFLNDVLYIGSRANSGSKFFGQLDDIKVTGAALSPSEFLTRRTIDQGTLTSVK